MTFLPPRSCHAYFQWVEQTSNARATKPSPSSKTRHAVTVGILVVQRHSLIQCRERSPAATTARPTAMSTVARPSEDDDESHTLGRPTGGRCPQQGGNRRGTGDESAGNAQHSQVSEVRNDRGGKPRSPRGRLRLIPDGTASSGSLR